jgi:GDP-L-fucose synthase
METQVTTLILGAAGFIGGALFRKMRYVEGVIPIATSSTIGRNLDRDPRWLEPLLVEADTVYLCAGQTGGVGKMATDPMSFILPNVRIHMNVFELCAKHGVKRVICVQSTTGYPDSPRPMREDQYHQGTLHPAYRVPGTAHRFIEKISHLFPFETLFFRPSNVYGPGNDFSPDKSHVIEATVRKVAERQNPFVIWGDGSQTRDAVFISDLVDAMILGAKWPAGAYNIAAGEEMDVTTIAKTLCDHAGFDPEFQFDLTRPQAIPARRLDISLAKMLGWSPKVSMKEGLALTYDWFVKEVELSA